MATNPAPIPQISKVVEEILSIKLPGESIGVALINFFNTHRETMSQENRDRLDALFISQLVDLNAVWRGLLVEGGILPAITDKKVLQPTKS